MDMCKQFTHIPDKNNGKASVVYAFRVSPKQHEFLRSLKNARGHLCKFIDSLRMEEMPPEEKILMLLHRVRNLEREIDRLESNVEYRRAKERIKHISSGDWREATKEEYEFQKKEFLRRTNYCPEEEVDSDTNLQEREKLNMFFEPNPRYRRLQSFIIATEKSMERKRQETAGLEITIESLEKQLVS